MSRLIDADALIDDMEKRYCKDCERRKGVKGGKVRMLYEIGEAPCRACGMMDAMDEIYNAPTVYTLETAIDALHKIEEIQKELNEILGMINEVLDDG